MVYVTGDCHGDFRRFSTSVFPEQREMSKDDYVIICGDFGGVWEDSNEQKYWLRWLEEKPFTTLWLDGNHENFDMLSDYMIKDWNGGKVQYIRPSIIHLMRGQVYEIEGKKIFTFGGASSHDTQGGILEKDDPELISKKDKAYMQRLPFRINHVSWWKEELPSKEEIEIANKNLEKNDYKVDFILSHCAPTSVQNMMRLPEAKPDILTDYFEEVMDKCSFDKWIFGHYHNNMQVDDKFIVLYEQIVAIC